MRKKVMWILGVGIGVFLLIGLLFIPVIQTRHTTLGTDSFEAHHSITKDKPRQQLITLQGQLEGIAAIIVPRNREKRTTDVIVTIKNKEGAFLAETLIKGSTIQDDFFTSTEAFPPLGAQGDVITIEFSTPTNTDPTVAGLRFDEDSYNKTSGANPTYAVAVREKVSLLTSIITTITLRPETFITVAIMTGIAAIYMIGGLYAVYNPSSPRTSWVGIVLLLVILILTLTTRLHILKQLGGVSGGDAYNYLDITKNISEGENPFANTKRLPGYPLLLLPSYTSSAGDPIHAMRLIGIMSSIGIIACMPVLSKRLGLLPITGLIAALLLSINKDFLMTSLRPEAYTFYALLVITALTLYLKRTTLGHQIGFSVFIGYAAMTRQEGFLLAFVFGICELIQLISIGIKQKTWRISYTSSFISFLPALFFVLPFFVHNTVAYGNPLFTPYFEGERLQIVDSVPAFFDSLGATWGITGSTWKPSWDELVRVSFLKPSFIISGLFILLYSFFLAIKRPLHSFVHSIGLLLLLSIPVITLYNFITSNAAFHTSVTLFTAAVALASLVPFMIKTRSKGLVLIAILLTQALIATWFHPFTKHYQQVLPLFFLITATGITLPFYTFNKDSRIRNILLVITSSLLLLPYLLSASLLWKQVGLMIDKQNAVGALDSAVYRAVMKAKQYPGPHGFNQAYQQARTFFGEGAYYFLDDDTTPPVEQQRAWLKENNIRILVVTNNSEVLKDHDPSWKQLNYFKSEGRDEQLFESFVFEIPSL